MVKKLFSKIFVMLKILIVVKFLQPGFNAYWFSNKNTSRSHVFSPFQAYTFRDLTIMICKVHDPHRPSWCATSGGRNVRFKCFNHQVFPTYLPCPKVLRNKGPISSLLVYLSTSLKHSQSQAWWWNWVTHSSRSCLSVDIKKLELSEVFWPVLARNVKKAYRVIIKGCSRD